MHIPKKIENKELEEAFIIKVLEFISEKKFSKTANIGWFGIGDKYWISSVIPPRNKVLEYHLFHLHIHVPVK